MLHKENDSHSIQCFPHCRNATEAVGARLDKSCNANSSQLYSDHHSVHKAESSLLTLGQAAMMNNTPAKTLRRLTDLETGSCASVARIKLDAAEEAHLSELGLRPGAEIRRLHGEAGQSILIGVGDGRIGVNFDTAKRIYVF